MADKILDEISAIDRRTRDVQVYPVDLAWLDNFKNSGASILASESDSGSVVVLDWTSQSRNDPVTVSVLFLERLIRNELDHLAPNEKLDLHFIGHSRGTILNAGVIGALGDDPRIDHLRETMLDPTAAVGFGDIYPTVVPSQVNMAINFHDTLSLNEIMVSFAPVPAMFGSASVLDGIPLLPSQATPGSIPEVQNVDKTDILKVRHYIAKEIEEITNWPLSAYAHSDIVHLYIDNLLGDDIAEFLGMKDRVGEQENFGGKGGHGTTRPIAQPGVNIADDHPDTFGPSDSALRAGTGGDLTGIGNINRSADHDWFQFRADRSAPIRVEARSLDGALSPHARLHWDNRTLIAQDGGRGAGTSAVIRYAGTEAGRTYYLDVTGAGGSTGNYVVVVSYASDNVIDPAEHQPPPVVSVDDFPDTQPTARVVALDARGRATVSGNIEVEGDDDWVRITAKRTGPLLIEVDTPYSSLDTHLRLHNAGTLVAQDDRRIVRTVSAGESYWLHVRAGSNSGAGDIRPGLDRIGRYVVRISQPNAADLPGDSGTDGPDGPLPGWGNVRGVQINLANGSGQSSGSIDEPSEINWFEIHGAQAGNMLVTVAGSNDDLTEFVTVYRANGGGIDTDAGDTDGQARVGFRVAAGEIIVVAVSSHEGHSTGSYSIRVEQPPTLPNDLPDFGETPRDLSAEVTDEGNGFLRGRIEDATDNDWFSIPVHGAGYMTIWVDPSGGSLVPFLELNGTGDGSGWFESADGRTGRARVTFLPPSGMTTVWVKVSALDGTGGPYVLNVWRGSNPDDDYPDRGGRGVPGRPLGTDARLSLSGRLEHPGDIDSFRILTSRPGPVAIEIISRTPGFSPFLRDSWQTSNHQGDSNTDGGSGRGGRTIHIIANVLPSPDNWVNFDISGSGLHPYGDYELHVWQPVVAGDLDPNTVGSEASPILLDGTGTGSLPGAPNGIQVSPALDYAGDVDVFQVRAASSRPISFRTSGRDTFLRVYDASGRAVSTDHDSAPGGGSQITLDARRGDLYYIEVSAFNGTDVGLYNVFVSQPLDDHPDAQITDPRSGQTPDGTVLVLDESGAGQSTGRIDPLGDRDVFQVWSASRGQFTVDVITTDDNLDTFLRIYDSRGNLVAGDDDGGDVRNSHIIFSSFPGETYSIEISGYNDTSIGAYRVSVQAGLRPEQTFVGTYDGFAAGTLDDRRWRTTSTGTGVVQVSGGRVQLRALGNGAEQEDNSAVLRSRASVGEDLEFDFTAQLGTDQNFSSVEVTDGTDFLRLRMDPSGTGGINLSLQQHGYNLLEGSGVLTLVPGASYHVRITQSGGEIAVFLGGTRIARLAGALRPNSVLRGSVSATRLPIYDDFNDSSVDANRWNTTGEVVEQGGRLYLWMYRNGGLRYSLATTEGRPGGMDILGFKLNANRTGGTVSGGQAESEVSITNGIDAIIIKWLNDANEFVIRATGYYGSGDIFRWDPDSDGPAETPDGPLEIRQNGSTIEVLHNNAVKFTFGSMSIRPGSYFRAEAFGQAGEGGPLNRDYEISIDDLQLYTAQSRLAQLEIDDVRGTLSLPADAVARLYDDFGGEQIDPARWQVAGTVTQLDGVLHAWLFRDGQPVNGFATTAGLPGGTNLRGFRLGSNRSTQPRVITGWDTTARVELTNGADFIRIGWTMKRNSFLVETGGSYGVATREIVVPPDQIPDGPLEVRERDGAIEVLHNGQVQLSIPNQTIRAGSYFQLITDGDPERKGVSLPGIAQYDVTIDNLQFYHDQAPTDLRVSPSLSRESDSGVSDSDQVTNRTTVEFVWSGAPAGTRYQWREGELRPDGSTDWSGPWSALVSQETATITPPATGLRVFSVRTIDGDGIVGEPTSRGYVVDTSAPSPMIVPVTSGQGGFVSSLSITFGEVVSGFDVSDLRLSRDGGPNLLTGSQTLVSGDNASWTLTNLSSLTGSLGHYVLSLVAAGSGIVDSAGNALAADAFGSFMVQVADVPPTLAAVGAKVIPAGQSSVDVALSADDPDGDALDYTASAESLAYHVDQSLGLYHSGDDGLNFGGRQEKWLSATSGGWYFVLPDGSLHRWDGGSQATGTLVAAFGPAVYADTSLLHNAQPGQARVALTFNGATLRVTAQPGFLGAYVTATVDDRRGGTASRSFLVTAAPNRPPTLDALADRVIPDGQTSVDVALVAADPDGDALDYRASAESLAYRLDQTLGLFHTGDDGLNWGGSQEKWIATAFNGWYFVTPDGSLYRWDGGARAAGALVAVFDPSVYADTSLLYNAQPGQARVGLTFDGATLRVTAQPGFLGAYVTATVDDRRGGTASRSFLVTAAPNRPPTLAAVSDRVIADGQTDVDVPLSADDPDGDTLIYTATAESLAYQVDQALGLYHSGDDGLNFGGRQEKWLSATTGGWYFVTPDGSLHRWDGAIPATGTLVATFGPAVYADTSLLYNAQPGQARVALTFNGATLRVTAQPGFLGAYVTATVDDRRGRTASRSFRVGVAPEPPVPNATAESTADTNVIRGAANVAERLTLTKDSTNLSMRLDEVGGDGISASLAATSTQAFARNFVVFPNREQDNSQHALSYLDDVVISRVTAAGPASSPLSAAPISSATASSVPVPAFDEALASWRAEGVKDFGSMDWDRPRTTWVGGSPDPDPIPSGTGLIPVPPAARETRRLVSGSRRDAWKGLSRSWTRPADRPRMGLPPSWKSTRADYLS